MFRVLVNSYLSRYHSPCYAQFQNRHAALQGFSTSVYEVSWAVSGSQYQTKGGLRLRATSRRESFTDDWISPYRVGDVQKHQFAVGRLRQEIKYSCEPSSGN